MIEGEFRITRQDIICDLMMYNLILVSTIKLHVIFNKEKEKNKINFLKITMFDKSHVVT